VCMCVIMIMTGTTTAAIGWCLGAKLGARVLRTIRHIAGRQVGDWRV